MLRLGIDLGGTKIEAIVLDEHGAELFRQRTETPKGDYLRTLDEIVSLVNQAEINLNHQCTIGICIPGTISPDTGKVKNANSVCLIGKPLDQDIEQRLQRPVKIANDADCFTISEATDGSGQQSTTVFGVILGTGVGGGISVHKQLLYGPNRIAGEWGHNPLPWPSKNDLPVIPCYCGQHGCIETYLSGPALCQRYQSRQGTSIQNVQTLIQKLDKGDSIAKNCFSDYCTQLAKSLASVINIIDPDIIVLGGGLSNISALYQAVPPLLSDYVFSDTVNTPIVAATHGDSSGVRGAAWLWS